MYSLNDMDRLLEIKDYISEGYNIAAIKKKYSLNVKRNPKAVCQILKCRALHKMNSSKGRVLSVQSPFLVG